MIIFYVANDINEAKKTDDYLIFHEEIHESLEKEKDLPSGIRLIAELDPYNDRILQKSEIEEIKSDIENNSLLNKYEAFLNQLHQLCEKAIEKNKLIFALGD